MATLLPVRRLKLNTTDVSPLLSIFKTRLVGRNPALLQQTRYRFAAKHQPSPSSIRFINTVPNTSKHEPFRSMAAQSIDSLPKPPPKKPVRPQKSGPQKRSRLSKFFRFSTIVVGLGALGYAYDVYFNARAFTRTLRTVYVFTRIAIDYKLNFAEGKDIQALHLRSADRLFDLLVANKGLYIKMGQAVAVQAAMFPPAFQEKFAKLFDDAPADTWEEVRQTVFEEFGKEPEELFEDFDRNVVASASIAQVYKARLKSTGQKVAVKIQHANIPKQMHLDLMTYRGIMWVYEKIFDMPLYFISKYISSRMKLEIDFLNEAKNTEVMKAFVEHEYGSGDFPSVYVPKVFREYSTKRVMVTEWIDGVSLSDKEGIRANGFNVTQIVDTVLTLFAKQIFAWGPVHCDPHPGNIIIRSKKAPLFGKPKQQVVLIDHGLYVYTTPKFRAQYSQLWQSMFLFDDKTIKTIMKAWGIGAEDLFASSVMLKPYSSEETIKKFNGGNTDRDLNAFEMQQKMKSRLKHFIVDTTHMPLELVFFGRTMGLLAGLNRMYGSPVNRVKIMAFEASRCNSMYKAMGISITRSDNDSTGSATGSKSESSSSSSHPYPTTWLTKLSLWIRAWWDYTKFRLVVALSDVAFGLFRIRQLLILNQKRRDQKGMEDYLEKQMTGMANKMGFEVKEGQMFSG